MAELAAAATQRWRPSAVAAAGSCGCALAHRRPGPGTRAARAWATAPRRTCSPQRLTRGAPGRRGAVRGGRRRPAPARPPTGSGSSTRSTAPASTPRAAHDWAVHVALWAAGELAAGAVALPGSDAVLTTDPAPVAAAAPRPAAAAADGGQPHPAAGRRRRAVAARLGAGAGADGLGRLQGGRGRARRGRRLRARRRPVRVGLRGAGRGRPRRRAARVAGSTARRCVYNQPDVLAARPRRLPARAGRPGARRRIAEVVDRDAGESSRRRATTRRATTSLSQLRDARGRVDPHHPRGRGRVRAAGAAVLRRQGLDRHAAARREGVLARPRSRSRSCTSTPATTSPRCSSSATAGSPSSACS